MSDTPLFENADEQEAHYAPDRVPGSGPAAGGRSSADAADTGLIPGAVAPVGGAMTPSTGSVFAPVAGGAGLDDMLDTDDTAADRDGVKE